MKRVDTNIVPGGSVYPSPSRDVPPASPTGTFQRVLSYSSAANRMVTPTLQGITNIQTQAQSQQAIHQAQAHQLIRQQKSHISPVAAVIAAAATPVTAASINPILSMPSVTAQGNQQFQRLKVEDALSYLDQVKYKFGNQPQVYNDFLDIMKEFKSQSIDTPGVIARVSNLFRGHPGLIVGFNTFLPPGYKIEVQANEVSVSMPRQSTPTVIHTFGIGNPNSQSITVKTTLLPLTSTNTQEPVPMTPPAVTPEAAPPTFPPPVPTQPTQPPTQIPLPIPPAAASQQQSTGQPVEFNHAINYVNKIKNRFQGQPDTYKQFLEILHTYQKEQRNLKEGSSLPVKHLSESEVYSQVARLFQHQEDLLREFGQFLPDATSNQNLLPASMTLGITLPSSQPNPLVVAATTIANSGISSKGLNNDHTSIVKKPLGLKVGSGSSQHHGNIVSSKYSSQPMKRPLALSGGHSHVKRPRMTSLKDVTLAEAGKHGTLNEYAFFDKVRKALRSNEVYENFLRCIVLFNQEIVSRTEVLALVTPFLGKFPELFKWFKDFLGFHRDSTSMETITNTMVKQERTGETGEIDFSMCKRLGASYCALPKSYVEPKCSGRTSMCREVLNDMWVSFPSWSEDSTFVSSRKTQFEEYIYRCEDERFELDLVLEVNAATIQILEGVQKKLSRMTSEEVSKFRLDEYLGGTSTTIQHRAIRRMYGDKAPDIIDGLIRNPAITLPIILRRMKAKEEEWREAQKGFNKVWQEQNEKYYLKSLDHQGINFKQNDVKAIRSKSLLNEIESIYDERHEQNDDTNTEPHMSFVYKDKPILDDAMTLLVHHVKRQIGIHKEDKQKMKQLLRQFIPDLFFHPRQELSEDEREDEDDELDTSNENEEPKEKPADESKENATTKPEVKEETSIQLTADIVEDSKSEDPKKKIREEKFRFVPHSDSNDPEERYTLFMGNNNWYLFLRLHYILCERLTKVYDRAMFLEHEEVREQPERKDSTSTALRLKPQNNIPVEDYYPAFLDMVKNVLDGNLECSLYEDTLREMFGIHAYIGFTLDKVVSCAVRQLQNIVTEESCIECSNLFLQEQKRGGTGGSCVTAPQRSSIESSYQRRAEQTLTDENCFRFVFYKSECKMSMTLLDTEMNEPEQGEEIEKWSSYLEKFQSLSGESLSEELREQMLRKPVFLPRNLKLWVRQGLNNNGNNNNNGNDNNGNNEKAMQETNMEDEEYDLKTDEEMPPIEDDEKMPILLDKPLQRMIPDLPLNIKMSDNSHCTFDLKSNKMFYVVNSENFMHKQNALKRARVSHKRVTLRMSKLFKQWHQIFIDAHISEEQHKATSDWLRGLAEDTVPNVTRVLTSNDLEKSPYAVYNRYRVKLSDQPEAKIIRF